MATRNQVLSLFGASPEQIMERQRQAQAKAIQQIRDPYQQTGTAIGMALGNMFGGESAEVARQRQLYSQLEGINFESPEQMRAAAATLKDQFPDRALQLLSLANQREAQIQDVATSQARQEAAEAQTAKAGFISVPKFVGYTSSPKPDGMGGFVMSRQPKYENTPIRVSEYDKWQNKEGDYADWYPSAEDMEAGATTTTNAIPENAIRFTTGTGTPVVLVNGKYFTATDEGNIGTELTPDALKALGGLAQQGTANTGRQPPTMPVTQEREARLKNQSVAPKPMTGTSVEDQTNPFAL